MKRALLSVRSARLTDMVSGQEFSGLASLWKREMGRVIGDTQAFGAHTPAWADKCREGRALAQGIRFRKMPEGFVHKHSRQFRPKHRGHTPRCGS